MENGKHPRRGIRERALQDNSLHWQTGLVLGLIVPDLSSYFCTQAFNAIEKVAAGQQYNLMVGQTNGRPEKEKMLVHQFAARQVAGIIISVSGNRKDYSQFLELNNLDLPVVFLGNIPDEENIYFVASDLAYGLTHGVRALREAGYHHFGLINGPEKLASARQILAAYFHGLKANGIDADPRLIVPTDLTEKENISALHKLLSLPTPPAAIFVFNEQILGDCLKTIEKMEKPGKSIQLISFSAWQQYIPHGANKPAFIEQFPALQGKLAANYLLDIVQKKNLTKGPLRYFQVLINSELVFI
ncbi:MAG: substrate-binding domain-containing protein [Bacteroidota bacterium]|nr:substrate-binding domain-containing protein [Bacteroidota bacterium]